MKFPFCPFFSFVACLGKRVNLFSFFLNTFEDANLFRNGKERGRSERAIKIFFSPDASVEIQGKFSEEIEEEGQGGRTSRRTTREAKIQKQEKEEGGEERILRKRRRKREREKRRRERRFTEKFA